MSFKKEDARVLREFDEGENGENDSLKNGATRDAKRAIRALNGGVKEGKKSVTRALNGAKTASKDAQNAKKPRVAAASSRKGETVTPKVKKTANKERKIAVEEAKFIDLLLNAGRLGTKSIYARHGVEGGFSNRIFGLFTEDFVRKEAIVSKRLREKLENGFELLKNEPSQEVGREALGESRVELSGAGGASSAAEVVKTKFDLRNFESSATAGQRESSSELEIASSVPSQEVGREALGESRVELSGAGGASSAAQRSQEASSSRKTQPTQSKISQNLRKVCELLQKGEARSAGFLSAKFFEQSGDARFSVLADLCTLVWWCDGDEFMQMMAMRFEPRDLPMLFSQIAKVDANGIEKYADEAWRMLLRTFFHPQHEFVQYHLAKKLAKSGDLLTIYENIMASGEKIEFGGLEDVADFLSRNLKSGEDEFFDIFSSSGEGISPEMFCFLMNLEDEK